MNKITFATLVSSALAALAIGLAGPARQTTQLARSRCRQAAPLPSTRRPAPPVERIRTRPSVSTRTSRTACGPSTEPPTTSRRRAVRPWLGGTSF
jgi:hypothetical protein